MPLVDLRTNLKSFKYGHDRPGGGDSGQPFITTDIDTGATTANVGARNILRLFGINQIPGVPNLNTILNRSRTGRFLNEALGGDEFIRGGITGAGQAALNDTLRIGLFFTSLPKGPIFVAKQVGLQLSNPKLEVKKGVKAALGDLFRGNVGSALGTLTGGLLQPTRVYNAGINTVAQVPVNAFGGHFYRHGILPIQSDDTKYEAVVKFNNDSKDSKNNRLIELADNFRLGDNDVDFNPGIFDLSKERKATRKTNKTAKREARKANKDAKAAAKAQKATNQRFAQQFVSPAQPGAAPFGPLLPSATQQSSAFGAAILGLSQPNTSFPTPTTGPLTKFGFNKVKPKKTKVNRSPKEQTIDSYIGGPGSTYGIGLTLIRRWEFSEDLDSYIDAITNARENAGKGLINDERHDITYIDPQSSGNVLENDLGEGDNAISEYDTVPDDIKAIGAAINIGAFKKYADLVSQIEDQQFLVIGSVNQFNIASVTRDTANGVGWASTSKNAVINDKLGVSGLSDKDLGTQKIKYQNSYGETVTINKDNWNLASRAVRVGSGRKDSINLTPLFKTKIGEDYSVVTIKGVQYTINDLCKFRIEAIDGDDPSKSIFMIFRAYLTDLSDDVNAEWNDIKYAGRGEKFYIYDGFTRTINVSFKVAALSAQEMEPMYQKLNSLMSNLMPDYSPGNSSAFPGTTTGVMRGPLVRMTIGNWIDSQPGVLKSLSYKVPQDSPWEIALNEPTTPAAQGGTREMILPHIVEVNLSFAPIGSQTQEVNKTPSKIYNTQHTSHIAQNYNGAKTTEINGVTYREPNYINGQSIVASGSVNFVGGGIPSQPY
jgi:hypothetical protein